jgi:hypothetical protein|tara:strand:- start:410 stop:625 length:216 start_codon:yes stop_codon:yes gene_type:complete
MGNIKFGSKHFDEILGVLVDSLVLFVEVSITFFLLDLADIENVIDGVNNLTNFLRIIILLIDFIFEVLLQN